MELLRRYSNQERVLAKLSTLLELPDQGSSQRTLRQRRQLQHRLAEAQQQRVIAAYEAGDSVDDLATKFGIAGQTAAAILERHGIKRRYKVPTAEMITIAIQLYEGGSSLPRVGTTSLSTLARSARLSSKPVSRPGRLGRINDFQRGVMVGSRSQLGRPA